jgi:threonine aldolase
MFSSVTQCEVLQMQASSELAAPFTKVSLVSDGLDLSPAEYAQVLADIATSDVHGVDVYGDGGVVAALESRLAEELGKPSAAIMPTGTMSNLLAIQSLAGKYRKAVVQKESHFYSDTGDCAQSLAGINLVPMGPGAMFDVGAVASVIERAAGGKVAAPVGVISIESPVRRMDGEMFDFDTMQAISQFARKRKIGMHLDGARLYVASAYSGRALTDFTGLFDTVYVSLYKNFNSLSGAILAGPTELIDQLRHWRRRNGGGLARWWPTAAISLHYVDGLVGRLKSAADRAEIFYDLLAKDERFAVEGINNGSSVRYLSCPGRDQAFLQELRIKLKGRNIELPPADVSAGHFALKTNESWLRAEPESMVKAFRECL